MDHELDLVNFLCGHIDRQLSPQELPSHFQKDPKTTGAWLRDLKRRGSVSLVEDKESGIPEILMIAVHSRIKVRQQEIEHARRAMQGSSFNLQIVGDHGIGVLGDGNSVNQTIQSNPELGEILRAVESLVAGLKGVEDSKEKEALLSQLQPIHSAILNPQTEPGKIQRWWSKSKPWIEGMATADGVLSLIGRASALIALWKALE